LTEETGASYASKNEFAGKASRSEGAKTRLCSTLLWSKKNPPAGRGRGLGGKRVPRGDISPGREEGSLFSARVLEEKKASGFEGEGENATSYLLIGSQGLYEKEKKELFSLERGGKILFAGRGGIEGGLLLLGKKGG